MSITFETEAGNDQVIRPPAGVVLPAGKLRVTVHEVETVNENDSMAKTRAMLLSFAQTAEKLAPNLPADMAENHDHYAHGKPKS